jgi:tripartite ATP-independent transporter DctM subunit
MSGKGVMTEHTLESGQKPDAAAIHEGTALIAARLNNWLRIITEIPSAILMVLEVAILLIGVISRYCFAHPLPWSDELASILFLWLSMLGSAIAMNRGAHMRLTVVSQSLGPKARAWVDTFAAVVVTVFMLFILGPANQYGHEQWDLVTPSMQIPGAVRAYGMLTGAVLIVLFAVTRLLMEHSLRVVLSAAVPVVLGFILLSFLSPTLMDLGNTNLVIFFVGMILVLLMAGVPIAFCFGMATLCYIGFSTDLPLSIIVDRMDEGMSHLILLSIPMFVLLGLLMEACGMAASIVAFLSSLVGNLRGGLSYVLMGGMYVVSGISGSKAADMAAIAPVLFPEMERRGAKREELTALLASSAAMSETIPPSLVLIAIGSVTGVSIAALFTGGLLPALIVAIVLCVVARFRTPAEPKGLRRRFRLREIIAFAGMALPGLALPFIIRSAVIEGVATATEVSTLGIIYTLLIGFFFYRQLKVKKLYPLLVDTAVMSGAILLIIGTATSMAWSLAQSGFSEDLINAMQLVPGGWVGFMAISIVAFIILGSVLEGIPAVVLFAPLLFPIAKSFGINEVHYAIVVVLAMGVGLFSPPFGVGYYTACVIARIDPALPLRAMVPYILALIVGLAIVAAIPASVTAFL